MSRDSLRILSMAGAIIALAGIASWFGLAHGCEQVGAKNVVGGTISLAPDLTTHVDPDDVLFIIVRRPQGMPRPIAVQRIDDPRFPVTFEITNQDVMMQGSALKGMVDVVARIDKDGVAGPPQAGDLEGAFSRNPTMVGSRDVNITIDTRH